MTYAKVIAEREDQAIFVLNGITYVPHYRNAGQYVSPGYNWYSNAKTYSAEELTKNGAEEKRMFLWPRPKLLLGATA